MIALKQKIAYALAGIIAFTGIFSIIPSDNIVYAATKQAVAKGVVIQANASTPSLAASVATVPIEVEFTYEDTAEKGTRVVDLINQGKVTFDGVEVPLKLSKAAVRDTVSVGERDYIITFTPEMNNSGGVTAQIVNGTILTSGISISTPITAIIKITGTIKASDIPTVNITIKKSTPKKTVTKKKTTIKKKTDTKKKTNKKKKSTKKTAVKKTTKKKSTKKKSAKKAAKKSTKKK